MTHDLEDQLRIVWAALDAYDDSQRDQIAGDGYLYEGGEEQRDDICTAMAVIREGLGLPDESAPAAVCNCADVAHHGPTMPGHWFGCPQFGHE